MSPVDGLPAGLDEGPGPRNVYGAFESSPAENSAGRLGEVAVAMIVGLVLGRVIGGLWWWLLAGGVFGLMMAWMGHRRCRRGVWCWAMLGCVVLFAAWYQVRAGPRMMPATSIARRVGDEPTLVRLRGRIRTRPVIHAVSEGPFAPFDYRSPRTGFQVRVRSLARGGGRGWTKASGKLLVSCHWADITLKRGDRVEVLGWMSGFGKPRNPGEPDYAARLADRGIAGRLSVRNRGNLTLRSHRDGPKMWARVSTLRRHWADAASDSLAIGLRDRPEQLALLKMLLLGQWDTAGGELQSSFRRAGLAHLLSISGAHLGILLGMTWLVARLFVHRPPRVVLIVLAVLVMYLLTVPIRVPIVRASIMAGLLCLGNLTGRQLSRFAALAAAAIVLLIWRPGDLFEPGFQLSFLAVGALMAFTRPLSQRIAPPPEFVPAKTLWTWHWRLRRVVADYLSANVVAFLAVMPLVAYHFELINPLAVAMALVTMPAFTLILAVGYLKVVVGLVLPSFSLMLSTPLGWLTSLLLGLVHGVNRLPWSSIHLTYRPALAWVLAAIGCCWALGRGWFLKRKWPLAGACVLLIGWLWVGQNPRAVGRLGGESPAVIELRAFAVGDGSCFIVQGGGQTWMFDCGSREYLDVGQKTIVPALTQLGITHIDTLIVSHSDIDHFAGTLAVIDHVGVDRVLTPPTVLDAAKRDPKGPPGFMVRQMRKRHLPPQPVTRGFTEKHGEARFEILWPPEGFVGKRTNNNSIVLSVRCGRARVLLCGDIMDRAMTGLIDSETDLRATVMELPHHGGFVDNSPRWLEAVSPDLVVQSAGYRWRMTDHWPKPLKRNHVKRLVTNQAGMITLDLTRAGEVRVQRFVVPK